ncbi:MAG: UDP-3-O-(3-hydroxymyristoyl)glucosamine N-acyltransferase [Legionellales bacterium]|jgi:UDP-3-O-[3-hydroxymyristoyl] glucosamine N-acyltransferase|nr:UDP-3-O-(3-hydroxymyristoyl)glucosamine N-acyltransferase [Legionellales bacterium]
MKTLSLVQIAKQFKLELIGSASDIKITNIASLEDAGPNDLSFFENKKLLPELCATSAAAVIINAVDAVHYPGVKLISSNPRFVLAKISDYFAYKPKLKGVAASAVVGDGCDIDPDVVIGANAVVGNNVVLAAGVCVGAGCVIDDYVKIGVGTELKPNVTIMHHVEVGSGCIFHSGSIIGSDGLGYAFEAGQWQKIEHLGAVVIGDNVDIGAATSVDRGTLGNTIIHNGAKLDNQIQIGHNVEIGAHTIIAGTAAIAGSAKIGSYCQIGGGALINGHISIADKTVVTGGSSVQSSIDEPGIYSSSQNALPHLLWNRNLACYKKLYKLARRVTKLERD